MVDSPLIAAACAWRYPEVSEGGGHCRGEGRGRRGSGGSCGEELRICWLLGSSGARLGVGANRVRF